MRVTLKTAQLIEQAINQRIKGLLAKGPKVVEETYESAAIDAEEELVAVKEKLQDLVDVKYELRQAISEANTLVGVTKLILEVDYLNEQVSVLARMPRAVIQYEKQFQETYGRPETYTLDVLGEENHLKFKLAQARAKLNGVNAKHEVVLPASVQAMAVEMGLPI